MSIAKVTPLLIFTYNRPEHTRQTVQALAYCKRLDECQIIIFSDAIKTPEDTKAVQEVRTYIQAWSAGHNATIIERQENLGLATSISRGVTEYCNSHGRVIVLEDDLIVHPDFINYMLQALDHFENCEQVYQISGFMYPLENASLAETAFMPFITSWGWATWQRAWSSFTFDIQDVEKNLKDKKWIKRFDINNTYDFSHMLKRFYFGKRTAWAIFWYYAVFQNHGLALYPRETLVKNIGHDGSGMHCGPDERKNNLPIDLDRQFLSDPVVFPSEINIDQDTFSSVRRYFRKDKWKGSKNRMQYYIKRVIPKLKELLLK
ncbi:MAG: glycosyltransferase [Anaerolineaceae bacterium]|nr:glycosyltransferase [Anaerolineaceae bacterium]